MITRLVKMTFKEAKIADFKEFTGSIEHRIRSFPGCEQLDFYQDIHKRNVFFTYSRWKSEEDLNNYRSSDFFKDTWTKTSAWFAGKPEAWSLAAPENV
jgi:quinol monooxygenase YgiN